jgi:hypothetical protein
LYAPPTSEIVLGASTASPFASAGWAQAAGVQSVLFNFPPGRPPPPSLLFLPNVHSGAYPHLLPNIVPDNVAGSRDVMVGEEPSITRHLVNQDRDGHGHLDQVYHGRSIPERPLLPIPDAQLLLSDLRRSNPPKVRVRKSRKSATPRPPVRRVLSMTWNSMLQPLRLRVPAFDLALLALTFPLCCVCT